MQRGKQGGWAQRPSLTPGLIRGLIPALILGLLAPFLLRDPLPVLLIFPLLAAGIVLLIPSRIRWAGFFVLGAAWSAWQIQLRLDDRLDPALATSVHKLTGVVSSLPEEHEDYLRFLFKPEPSLRGEGIPSTLLVYWYRERPELRAGQIWNLELLLKPPWAAVNFQGPDRERWLFSQGIGGLATVRGGEALGWSEDPRLALQSLREAVRDRIIASAGESRESGVLRALAIADRSGMSRSDQQLMMATGTSHLLAISGLHIGLAAVGGFWISRTLLWLLPLGRRAQRGLWICAGGALLLAGAYACLAGLGVSTRRAWLMLLTGMGALALARNLHPARALALSLAAVLLLDPFAALSAGFWFSYLAVGALLFVFVPRLGPLPWWKRLLLAQAAVMVVMLPVGIYWFEAFALTGFLANLAAIPWVSFVLVPLTLLGVVSLGVSAALAGLVLNLAAKAGALMLYFLEKLDSLPGFLSGLPAPAPWHLALGVLAALLLTLPPALKGRWLGMFALLPLFLPWGASTPQDTLLVEVLDVGQGTAVTVSTSRHSLLYDSGPGDGGGWHRVDSVLRPALARRSGASPQRVIISHGDLDHAGGLGAVLQRYPAASFNTNLRDGSIHAGAGIPGCDERLRWRWQGAHFEVLHPSPSLPYLGNDSSCVLGVRLGRASILLSGDISRKVEDRLLAEGLGSYRVLLVPHHGSATSSGPAFIERVAPLAAIGTNSLGNRFGFPKAEIRQRYLDAGVPYWSSGECGALRLVMKADGSLGASSARRVRKRPWRWPAADGCP